MKYFIIFTILLSITLFACQNATDSKDSPKTSVKEEKKIAENTTTSPKTSEKTTTTPTDKKSAQSKEKVPQDQKKDTQTSANSFSTTKKGGNKTLNTDKKEAKSTPPSKEKQKAANTKTKVTFPAKDNLNITANLYHHDDQSPTLVLLHQARSNKSEYHEMSKRFFDMGYNALAVDLRSGGSHLGGINETTKRAKKAGMPDSVLTYRHSIPDIEAAIDFAAQKYKKPIILVGSSYSAALALKVANKNKNVKAVAAFSPGEYFGKDNYIANSLKGFDKPVWITGSQREERVGKAFFDIIEVDNKTQFVPKAKGAHGARALWKAAPGSKEYWAAFTQFLDSL